MQTTEKVRRRGEDGGSSDGQGGEGEQWWPGLIEDRVSDHASNVCLSGPAEVANWGIWSSILRQRMIVCHPCESFAHRPSY